MRRTSFSTLAWAFTYGWGTALIVCAFALHDGRAPFAVPLALAFMILVVALIVCGWGLRVRASQRKDADGKRHNRELSPLYAARVAVMAQASSRGGAAFTGFFTMVAFLFSCTGHTSYVHAQIWGAVATALASVVLLISGCLTERWCSVNGGSDQSAAAV